MGDLLRYFLAEKKVTQAEAVSAKENLQAAEMKNPEMAGFYLC